MPFWRRTRTIPASNLEHGDIVLFEHDGTLGSFIIDLTTNSQYSHVALYDGDGMVIEAKPGGVRRAPIGTRKPIGLRVPVTHEQRKQAMDWASQQIGRPYDDRALLMIGIDRMFPKLRGGNPSAKRFTCAVFVSEAYHHAGVELLPNRNWSNIAPGDFQAALKEAPKKVVPD